MKFLEIGESFLSPNDKCIAPLLLGGIIAAGASLAGNAIGSASQSKTNDTSKEIAEDRKSTRLNSSHSAKSRMPSSA